MKFDLLFVRPPVSKAASAALLALRLVAGAAFIRHGFTKIQNPFAWMGADSNVPGFLQALAAISEFGGGFAWMIGFLVPIASFGIFCTMAVAVSRHLSHGDPFVGKGGSYELALVYACVAALLFVVGPGKIALDSSWMGQDKLRP